MIGAMTMNRSMTSFRNFLAAAALAEDEHQHGRHQAEKLFVGFVGRQQLFGDLSEIIQRHAERVFRLQPELRLDQLAAGKIGQWESCR